MSAYSVWTSACRGNEGNGSIRSEFVRIQRPETVENVVFRLVPSAAITAMMATAIPVAKSPYSIAAAPSSSCTKRPSNVRTT